MAGFDLVQASELPVDVLAATFNAGYEGYAFPVRLDAQAFLALNEPSDVDFARSRVALSQGEPVGICLLAVRGDLGWIGGLGIAASARRRGLGRLLMEAVLEEASAAGLRGVSLEVLERNDAAITLYERLGFATRRMLEVWTMDAAAPPSRAVVAALDWAQAWIAANRAQPEPWQRADESLAHLVERAVELEGLVFADRAAAVLRRAGDGVSILQLVARDEDAAVELLAAARARGATLRFVNVPEGDPASTALQRLGGRLEVRQLEMARPDEAAVID